MRIQSAEQQTYDDMWGSVPAYGDSSPGEQLMPIILEFMQPPSTVLDAGCGSGKTGVLLAEKGFRVALADLTDAGLSEEAKALPFRQECLWTIDNHLTYDYVVCCDVLEHLPTQFTMLAVEKLLRIAKQGLFLNIHLLPDAFGVWVGKPLHQTIQPFMWWRDSLREIGSVIDARDLLFSATFFVRAR